MPSQQILADVVHKHPGQEPRSPFPALLDMQPVTVTATLERTAVIQIADADDKRLVRLTALVVNAELLEWVTPQPTRWVDGIYSWRDDSGVRGRSAALLTRTSRSKSELQLLREQGRRLRQQGKRRCCNPSCHYIGPVSEFHSTGYCKPCSRIKNASYKAKRREKAVA